MFKARCLLYYKANNPKPQHKSYIEKSDKILINTYFCDAFTDPKKLQEYVWNSLIILGDEGEKDGGR